MAEHAGVRPAHAYILIQVEPAQTQKVVQQLRQISGAVVHEVLGPFDIVVELEAEAPEYITSILRQRIRPMAGVQQTVTCNWIE